MLKKVLTGKIHHATVTQCNLDYVGSVTVDEDLLRAAGIRANEFVQIADMDNGSRLETYVIKGPAGSGIIGINGAAAHLISQGDRVILFATGLIDEQELDAHRSQVVICDAQNRIAQELSYPSSLDEDLDIPQLSE